MAIDERLFIMGQCCMITRSRSQSEYSGSTIVDTSLNDKAPIDETFSNEAPKYPDITEYYMDARGPINPTVTQMNRRQAKGYVYR